MRIAILDLGTNIFNLLVIDVVSNSFNIVEIVKLPVKLGRDTINENLLSEESMNRGYNVIEKHLNRAGELGAEEIKIFATSAIRSANNGPDFVNEVKKRFNQSINVITGDQEATLIYHGAINATKLGDKPVLVLDIGGGSNEFIIGNNKEIFWKKSFNLGVARLLKQFNPSSPITKNKIGALNEYLSNELVEFKNAYDKFKPETLIGCAGSFDTFITLIAGKRDSELSPFSSPSVDILKSDFIDIHNQLISSTVEDILLLKGMDPMRTELIVLASCFVKYVLDITDINTMVQSSYALKEGVASILSGFNIKSDTSVEL